MSPYLTIENASNIYLRKDTASTTYATKSEVISGLSGKLDSATYTLDKNTFATKTELGTKLDTSTYTTDKDTFALKTELNSYATKAELSSYATIESLSDYATIASLINYATTTALNEGLTGKANTVHSHAVADISDFTTQVNALINNSKTIDYGRVGT